LISVWDKRSVVEFARALSELGWEIVSTGGTGRALSEEGIAVTAIEQVTSFPEILDEGIAVTAIEQVTSFPEILDGRVKTLHPAVHAAVLARRDIEYHMDALAEHGFGPIDLVAVNLYPFRETIANPRSTLADAIEQIDVGGPTMLRAAAKNHEFVIPVVDPRDYQRVITALRNDKVPIEFRRELAAKVFNHTALYDVAIAEYLDRTDDILPSVFGIAFTRLQSLRYGENPEQRAALYSSHELLGVSKMTQLHGKELSFNNILDIEGGVFAVSPWPDQPACAIMKHTTPCGIAVGNAAETVYRHALATDPTSAFGSVVAFNTIVDQATAEAMADQFVEVIVAPRFAEEALEVLRRKKNLRIVEVPFRTSPDALDFKHVSGGFLVQERFKFNRDEAEWKVVTKRKPTESEWCDIRFAWAAVAGVKSNAILLAKNEVAVGIGAGQMSRVDASFLAVHKARSTGHDPKGAVLASDAFFPFADGVEEAAKAGITAIVQPGGSKRDKEVIEAADKHDIAMVMTGRRQFRH
jgi:phosphoribosylaminoimidazolecarboxamide formyltransferase/IMP cyclohydrolase